MKVLLINGSPHEKGCTYTALSLIAGELKAQGIETEILHVGGQPVGGCIGCGGCRSGNGCVFGGVKMCSLVCGIGPSAAEQTKIAPSICAAPVIMFLT